MHAGGCCLLAVGVAGVEVRGKDQSVQLPRGYGSPISKPAFSGCGAQINQRQVPRGQQANSVGVSTVGRGPNALKAAAHQRREHGSAPLPARAAWRRPAGWRRTDQARRSGGVLGLFIVVAELHQQQIARAQSRLHRSPQALVVKTLGAWSYTPMPGAYRSKTCPMPHCGHVKILLNCTVESPIQKNTRCHKPKLPLLHYYIYYKRAPPHKTTFQPR